MGTPDFAVPIFEALIKSDFLEVVALVCNPDSAAHRKQILTPPPTKILAQKYDIPVLQPDKIRKPEWIEKIKKFNPGLIVVAAFGQIISKDILDIPKYGAINIHGSLLPKLRGASPVQYAILEGLEKTGITIMLMDEQMDHGQILGQKEIDIAPKETSKSLFNKMSQIGAMFLIDTLRLWIDGKIQPKEQNHNEATYTKILKKEDGKINWADSAEKIERQIRAFNPWPGAYCMFKDQNDKEKGLKIIGADVEKCDAAENKEFGYLFLNENKLLIKTGKDCLKLNTVQPEGKTPMSASDFSNGYSYLLKSNFS